MATSWGWKRIWGFIKQEQSHVVHGGVVDEDTKFVAPTLFYYDSVDTYAASSLAKEEMFGPLLSIIKYPEPLNP